MDASLRDIGRTVLTTNSMLSAESTASTEIEVVVINKYAAEIAVYFADGVSGMYLVSLLPEEQTTLEAYTGQSFYATAVSDGSHLLNFKVFAKKKLYVLGPVNVASASAVAGGANGNGGISTKKQNNSIALARASTTTTTATTKSVENVVRAHPYIIPLHSSPSKAHYAKFKYGAIYCC